MGAGWPAIGSTSWREDEHKRMSKNLQRKCYSIDRVCARHFRPELLFPCRPDGQLQAVSWKDALEVVAEAAFKVKPEEMVGIAGKLADAESMLALKDFLNRMGCERLWAEGDGKSVDADLRSRFLLNTGIANLETADVFLLVGTQLRWEAPMVNARLRKAVRFNNAKVAVVGPAVDLAYPHQHLGESTDTLLEIAEGRHPFCAEIASAERPVVIVGSGALERTDKAAIMSALDVIAQQSTLIREDWFGANVLLLNASQAAARDLGFIPGARAGSADAKFLYLLGADDLTPADIPEDAFVVYQGHHGDRSAYRANVILPGAAYTEKEGTYENLEGRAQQTAPAVPTVGDARDDWKIVRALSEVAGKALPYDTVNGLRARMLAVAPNLLRVDEIEVSTGWALDLDTRPASALESSPLPKAIENYYMTDAISRASRTMAQCTSTLAKRQAETGQS